MSNFTFFHNVFYAICILKSFNSLPNKPWFFTCLQYMSIENTMEKGEIARNEQFLLFPQCFQSVRRTLCHFHQIWNCHMQTFSIWKSLKFATWERVNSHISVVVCSFFEFGMVSKWSIRKWVNPLPHNDDFWRTGGKKPFENIVGKEENAGNVFYPMKENSNILSDV